MNLFYAIWADTIHYEKNKYGMFRNWKSFTFAYMSILISLNIGSLLSAILFFSGYNILAEIKSYLSFIPSEMGQKALWAILVLFLPSMFINYFFVFFRKKYNYILANYKFRNGRLLMVYFFLTILAFFGFGLLNST